MTKFIGTLVEFNRFMGGYCRNKVRQIATPARKAHNGTCEHCGKKEELQSAHITGFGRVKVIESLFQELYRDGIELNEFQEAFIERHMPIEEHFLFLCSKCHIKYDKKTDIVPNTSVYSVKKSPGARYQNNISHNIKLKCVREYLYNTDTSFRKVETDILKIDSPTRGGGFISKEIINQQGVTADKKGILSKTSIDSEIKNTNNDVYGRTLIEIKNQQSWRT